MAKKPNLFGQQNPGSWPRAICSRSFYYIFGFLLLSVSPVWLPAAERFGDILVAPQSLGTGDTRHGYVEHRVMVANESGSRSHVVNVAYPETSSGYGNRLGKLTRSTKLGPNSSVTLRFWQPALPVLGSSFAVEVDGRYQGSVAQTGNNNHARNPYGHGYSALARTYLMSRSLSGDDLAQLYSDTFGAPYSPAKATGRPDSSPGLASTAWIPAETNLTSEWLELDYEPAFRAKQVRVHETLNSGSVTQVVLFNTNGIQIATVATSHPAYGGYNVTVVDFPLTAQPVGRVRLEVRKSKPGAGPSPIDAVELVAPDKRAWAARARASSYLESASSRLSGITPSFARRYGLSTPDYNLVRTELEPGLWSDHWLAYTAYDAVLFTAKDHAAMPESARLALWRYAEGGGCLVVFGKIAVPDPWQARVIDLLPGAARIPIGFGHCLIFDGSELKQLNASQGRLLDEIARTTAWPWAAAYDVGAANAQFPVMANIQIPFRGMALILMFFVLLIGPVNLLLLMRYRKRIWSLWTIPVISFTTCGIVFAYSFLSEGVTPRLRIEGLTLLDQINHRATTLGMSAYYCPLTPSDGLHFSYETELTPVLSLDRGRQGITPEMDWTQDQHLHRGWLASRVPAIFLIRKSETRRERLQLEKSPTGQWAAVNGLGTRIQSLWLADFSGRNFTATNVMPGQKIILQTFQPTATLNNRTNQLAEFYRLSTWAPADTIWQKMSTNALSPGTYLARLDASPFMDDGLQGKTIPQKASVVLGILSRDESEPGALTTVKTPSK